MTKPTTHVGWAINHPVSQGGQPTQSPVEVLNHYKTLTHKADHADIVKLADFALTHGRLFFIKNDSEPVPDDRPSSNFLMLELSDEDAAKMRATLDEDYYDFDIINTLREPV